MDDSLESCGIVQLEEFYFQPAAGFTPLFYSPFYSLILLPFFYFVYLTFVKIFLVF